MRQIIRVEHEDGYGIFRSRLDDTWKGRPHSVLLQYHRYPGFESRHSNFNNPRRDGLNRSDADFCAFKSIEQIQQWIMPDEFEKLIEDGYKVFLIEVSECQEGRDNILFQKKHELNRKDISKIFIK